MSQTLGYIPLDSYTYRQYGILVAVSCNLMGVYWYIDMDFTQQLRAGVEHLSVHDEAISLLATQYGPPTFAPRTDYYQSLVSSIISQQLSVKAAATIEARFVALFDHPPSPEAIMAHDIDGLRSVGLSGQKTTYIRDLSAHVIDGRIDFTKFDEMTNDEIITELTAIKGVGVWTAHMFLLFCMGRLDVLADGDLGIKNAVTRLYGFKSTCTSEDIRAVATDNNWHPYESIACWYAWRSLDNKPAI